jgi:hypothetical protein
LIKIDQNPANMLKKLPVQPHLDMFKTELSSFNSEHEHCHLANKLDWKSFVVL